MTSLKRTHIVHVIRPRGGRHYLEKTLCKKLKNAWGEKEVPGRMKLQYPFPAIPHTLPSLHLSLRSPSNPSLYHSPSPLLSSFLPLPLSSPQPSSEEEEEICVSKQPKLENDAEEDTDHKKLGKLSKFPINKATRKILKSRGVKYLFPIQYLTFEPVYSGKDVIGQARELVT